MKFEIRNVSEKEIDLWLKLRMEVLDHVFPDMTLSEKTLLKESNYNYFKSAAKAQSHIATFAIKDNQIIGTGDICFYDEIPSPDNHNGKCGYLMNIYTRKKFRKKGVASAIVSNLIKIAHELEITKIYLESTQKALPLYKQLGFTEMKGYLKLKNE